MGRITGYGISLCTFFWLVSGEVTGDCFRELVGSSLWLHPVWELCACQEGACLIGAKFLQKIKDTWVCDPKFNHTPKWVSCHGNRLTERLWNTLWDMRAGTGSRESGGGQLDEVAHCSCCQRENCSYGVRSQRLPMGQGQGDKNFVFC